jgi:hypothetical protein
LNEVKVRTVDRVGSVEQSIYGESEEGRRRARSVARSLGHSKKH